MSKIDEAIALAKSMASDSSHGYDQTHRWGPDYDCSSFLIHVWESVGVPVKTAGATYTGNMRPAFLAAGFTDVTDKIYDMTMGAGIEPGDVLVNTVSHTAMYIGNGQLIQASQNERGGITGGASGDQTGSEIGIGYWYNYPWDCVLRYTADNIPLGEPESAQGSASGGEGNYTVQRGDTLWGIAGKVYGDHFLWETLAAINGIEEPFTLYAGQVLKTGTDEQCEDCKVDKPADTGGDTYTVKAGDTLWGISLESGISVAYIAQLNGIKNQNLIYPGQVLRLREAGV